MEWIYPILIEEFERLRSAGVQFTKALIGTLASNIIEESTHECFNVNTLSKNKELIILRVKKNYFVDQFCLKNSIVIRKQTGKLQLSSEKEKYIEKTVAYHLGQVKREFDSGMDENYIENMDETHFVINVDSGTTLGFQGDKKVKYADVSSGGEGMTMVVRISGGVNARLRRTMMIFKNQDSRYPITTLPLKNVPDDMFYRTGPRGWMDRRVFIEWIKEMEDDCHGIQRIIYLDNCGGHNETAETVAILKAKNIVLRRLPENATDLCQPADSFVIQLIKEEWKQRWSQHKFMMIKEGAWRNGPKGSGKLCNPGKQFFMNLADECIKAVNEKIDEGLGISFARKSMIRCGLAKNVDGIWSEKMLFQHLQDIVNEHREYFDGKVPEVLSKRTV